tara:strand:- start:232 stop:1044 length:813 start_codon:yes stop_codon:yes gene_type:complete
MNTSDYKALLQSAIVASIKAGKEILKVYEGKVEVEFKDDRSPLTEADKRAHLVIMDGLKDTKVPVLSEEGRSIPFSERSAWEALWVVDPLDGTKEFIKRNGEFTVNIALVENGTPTMGVIYVPVSETLYFGCNGIGAYKVDNAANMDSGVDVEGFIEKGISLPQHQTRPFTMVGSRSHMSPETAEYFEGIKKEHPNAEIISKGSSLKICMVAEGSADVYPRFAPTMEWDTAAGHGIVRQAGFDIYKADGKTPVVYNKEDLLNPWFIVKKK